MGLKQGEGGNQIAQGCAHAHVQAAPLQGGEEGQWEEVVGQLGLEGVTLGDSPPGSTSLLDLAEFGAGFGAGLEGDAGLSERASRRRQLAMDAAEGQAGQQERVCVSCACMSPTDQMHTHIHTCPLPHMRTSVYAFLHACT